MGLYLVNLWWYNWWLGDNLVSIDVMYKSIGTINQTRLCKDSLKFCVLQFVYPIRNFLLDNLLHTGHWLFTWLYIPILFQLMFTCPMSTIETIENEVKYVRS